MKKKTLFMIILTMIFLYVPSVLATNINGCGETLPGVAIDIRLANVVHTIIFLIQIAVPIVLVIFGMLDLFKGLTAQKEDEIKKGQQMLVKRLISAALVFFVIAIVKLVISLVAESPDRGENIITCANCFLNGADSNGNCK